MRHRKKKHLRGSHDRQKNELRALATALILYERITTTEARAKITRSKVEKMITKGKSAGLAAIRHLRKDLPPNAVKKVVEVLGPRFASRTGGFTRILRLGKFRDGTKKVMLEFVK